MSDQTYIIQGTKGFLSKQVRYTSRQIGCQVYAVEHWFWVFVAMPIKGPSIEVSFKAGLRMIGARAL